MTEYSAVEQLTAKQLHEQLLSTEELALIDVREIAPYSHGHILYAAALPLPRIEQMVADLIPRRSTPIVVCDGGADDKENPDLGVRAAQRLKQLGYTNVVVLAGGTTQWQAQGYELFAGMNVPSKAFGEFVEEHEDTPAIGADELKRMQDAKDDFVLLDSRPEEEFKALALPGSICCPGGELAYRVHDMVPSPDTTIVVNCAGRTRSIVGCQSLINAAIPNKVVALRNGVMGWHLAGHEIAFGRTDTAPLPSPEGLAKAQQSALDVAKRFDIKTVDTAMLAWWREQRETHSLYILDVRTAEEFEQRRLIDATHAPGGQLVQNTDFYVATRNARLVLVDTDQVRAVFAASWLLQMGHQHVYVFDGDWEQQATTSGVREKPILGLDEINPDTVSPATLKQMVAEEDVQICDVSLSNEYQAKHIADAWFVPRARLLAALKEIPRRKTLVLTSSDGVTAQLTAPELSAISTAEIKVLAGGNEAWAKAGYELQSGAGHVSLAADDQWQIPFLPNPVTGKTAEDNMREYLSWEVELINQIERDGTTDFCYFPRSKDGEV
ncbi:MAG: rhodanese-like domain-containing protein [Pseudomonadales bacterium]